MTDFHKQYTMEAITLHSHPLRDKSRIVKVFSKQRGILSFLINGISLKKSQLLCFCSPFTYAEINYRKGRGDFYYLQDLSIKDPHLKIREQLVFIEAATKLCQSILSTQPVEKPNTILFSLFESYLKKIVQAANPKTLSASFQIKLLQLEGIMHLKTTCSHCVRNALAMQRGESFCENHAPDKAIFFTGTEWNILQILGYAKRFSMFQNVELSLEMEEKVQALFKELAY